MMRVQIWKAGNFFKYRYAMEGEGEVGFSQNMDDLQIKKEVLKIIDREFQNPKVTLEKEI